MVAIVMFVTVLIVMMLVITLLVLMTLFYNFVIVNLPNALSISQYKLIKNSV